MKKLSKRLHTKGLWEDFGNEPGHFPFALIFWLVYATEQSLRHYQVLQTSYLFYIFLFLGKMNAYIHNFKHIYFNYMIAM